jgi:hypothetical protein
MGMEEIEARQKKIAKAAMELGKLADDPKALLARAAEIGKEAKELEKAANRFAEEIDAKIGGKEEVVVLTPDQRERVAQTTGVAMETLVVRDRDGSFARAMPSTQKMIIERMANQQATAIAVKKARRDAIDKLIKQLRKIEAPGIDEIIQAIEDDPTLEKLSKQQMEMAEELKAKHGME